MLGELEPLYHEYRQVYDNAPEEPVLVDYYPEVLADKIEKGETKREVSGIEHALVTSGFAGNVAIVFNICHTLETDPDATIHDDTLAMMGILKQVPAELRKKVRVMTDGYYYAGRFTRVTSPEQ